jgi:hypothetical protein
MVPGQICHTCRRQAMNQPVSGSPVVTHHLGALIALGTLLAINLAWMSKFFFGWW